MSEGESKSPAERLSDVREAISDAAKAAGRAPAEVTLVAVSKTKPVEAVEALLAAGQRVFGENRPKLARALLKEMDKQDRCPRCFIQVNTGAEEQKAGVLPKDALAFVKECRDMGLPVEGLMCIPPLDDAPEVHFAFLRELARRAGLEKLSMGMSGDYEIAVRFGVPGHLGDHRFSPLYELFCRYWNWFQFQFFSRGTDKAVFFVDGLRIFSTQIRKITRRVIGVPGCF